MDTQILLNPITSYVSECLAKCENELLIAVPFISSFAKSILTKEYITKIKTKKIITCLDENNLNSFELETLRQLIENNFKIVFNNRIHLKLYLFDEIGIISSSNLTKSGFEDNIELTSTISLENIEKSKSYFNQIWERSKENRITLELIEENYPKYLLLKKQASHVKKEKPTPNITEVKLGDFALDELIDYLFATEQDFASIQKIVIEANKERNRIKKKISSSGFKVEDFYVEKSHPLRNQTIHYQIVHGNEPKIAGSGLREGHFKEVAQSNQLNELMGYIYPPTIGKPEWNLNDENVYREFCQGIFDFVIPQYFETMPIRLASFFYPEYFLPSFKLDHLEQICSHLGLKTKCVTKGDKLAEFNLFLNEKFRSYPFDNYVKMNRAYQLYFIFVVKNGIDNGKTLEIILKSHQQKWKKALIIRGGEIIEEISLASK